MCGVYHMTGDSGVGGGEWMKCVCVCGCRADILYVMRPASLPEEILCRSVGQKEH